MVTSRFDKSTGICDFDDMVKSFKLLELPRKSNECKNGPAPDEIQTGINDSEEHPFPKTWARQSSIEEKGSIFRISKNDGTKRKRRRSTYTPCDAVEDEEAI